MYMKMEKFLEVDVARQLISSQATDDGTASGNGPNVLNDSGQTFTSSVAVGDWVYVYAVNGTPQASPHLYQIAGITSNTELALTPKGATAGQGTGVVAQGDYYIYSNTVVDNKMVGVSDVITARENTPDAANLKLNLLYNRDNPQLQVQFVFANNGANDVSADMMNGYNAAVENLYHQTWPNASAKWEDKMTSAGVASKAYKILSVEKIAP